MNIFQSSLDQCLGHGVVVVNEMGLVVKAKSFLYLAKLVMGVAKGSKGGSLAWIEGQALFVEADRALEVSKNIIGNISYLRIGVLTCSFGGSGQGSTGSTRMSPSLSHGRGSERGRGALGLARSFGACNRSRRPR